MTELLQKRYLVALLGVTSLLTSALGCQSDVESKVALAGLSSACRINSDCSADLACVFERCHEKCTSSRDCDHDARCVAGEGKHNVCQLADEAACSKSGACPGAQVCGADAACRDACSNAGQCLAEQICSGGTCADTAELNASGQLTPSVDRPVAAPQPCAFDSDCPAELSCLAGACAAQCQTDGDCRGGETCRGGRCQIPAAASAGCLRNSDCNTTELCVAGACQKAPSKPIPECAYDSDCVSAGQHCTEGACHCECATDADCSTHQRCEGECQCVAARVIDGNVNVTNALQLEALRDVVEITGQLTLNIPGFGEYHLPYLRKAGFLGALEHKATIVLDVLEEVTDLNCYQDCRAPRLKSAGSVTINSQVIREVDLPALETVGNFNVWYNNELTTVSVPLLKSAKVVRFEGNAKLTSVALPQLGSLDTVLVGMNDRLPTLSFPNAKPAVSISISSNNALTNVALPSASQLSEAVAIGNNPLLESLDLRSLEQVNQVSLSQMPKLAQLNLTSLSAVGAVTIGQTAISNLDSLNPDIAGVLATAGDLTFTYNPGLPTCALDALGMALSAKGWTGTIYQHDNLDCSCTGAVCQ